MKKDSEHVLSSHHSSPSRRNTSSQHHVASSGNAATSRGRIYTTITTEGSIAWVTRDIAALDFLLGIPLQAEPTIVQAGFEQQVQIANNSGAAAHHSIITGATGKWFEKHVARTNTTAPTETTTKQQQQQQEEATELEKPNQKQLHVHLAPGRRLDGDDAYKIQIPKTGVLETKTRQRTIARQAVIREWERQVAHGIQVDRGAATRKPAAAPPLLDNRVFFSAGGGYPMEIFSLVRYEPRREELLRKRQKLEELGGGGSEFVIPERDWRGTSYRALLPRVEKKNKSFQLLLGKQHQPPSSGDDDNNDNDDISTSSDESDGYVPGFLDDPEMVQGRHRHVMIGDRDTGSIVSSTIQFVKPEELKADLNKQFRERFDGWEPPKDQWKFIGGKIVDGVFTLQDPMDAHVDDHSKEERRPRQGSISSHTATTSSSVDAMHTIRMPPSLTLSKIRGVKQQALIAAVNANMEVSTVALACVYFERLCLDTRVDKSNRRLSFAACLLLASKINERNVRLDIQALEEEDEGKFTLGLHSQVRPTKDSNSMFASLLEFFAHDWSLSLKTVFAAEWGVFVALGFSLHTTPSQVAFHFKRMMKTLGWSSLSYLGPEMYSQWQQSLEEEAERRDAHEERKELRRDRKERKLLRLQRERLQQESEEQHRRDADSMDGAASRDVSIALPDDASTPSRASRKIGAMKLFHKFALKRNTSMEKLADHAAKSEHISATSSPKFREAHKLALMTRSPSLPAFSEAAAHDAHHVAIDIGEGSDDDISVGAVSDGGLMF